MKFEEIFGPDKCNLIFTLEITNKKKSSSKSSLKRMRGRSVIKYFKILFFSDNFL